MRHARTVTTLVVVLAAHAGPVSAQQSVEVYGDIGFTGMDAESWAGSALMDWDQFMSGMHAQLYVAEYGDVRIGAELGYRYLLWYQIQSGGFPVDRNVDAYTAMAVLRTPFTPVVFGEVSAGFYAFGDFVDPAIGAAVGGRIPLTERWSVPVKLRVGTVFDADANMVPLGLSLGVAYEFGTGMAGGTTKR